MLDTPLSTAKICRTHALFSSSYATCGSLAFRHSFMADISICDPNMFEMGCVRSCANTDRVSFMRSSPDDSGSARTLLDVLAWCNCCTTPHTLRYVTIIHGARSTIVNVRGGDTIIHLFHNMTRNLHIRRLVSTNAVTN